MPDHIGAFAVTSGIGLDELVKKFKADNDDYNAIMAEALADRLAEAFAEYLHKRAREEWGFGGEEGLTTDDLIEEKYRGIRPAAGYPACPDHTEKGTLWELLDVESKTGIKLTESFAMWPGSSVSGLYFAHPESKYFAVGKLGRDQLIDYHVRKGMTLTEVERWLGTVPELQSSRTEFSRQCAHRVRVWGAALIGSQSGPRRLLFHRPPHSGRGYRAGASWEKGLAWRSRHTPSPSPRGVLSTSSRPTTRRAWVQSHPPKSDNPWARDGDSRA